MHAISPDQTPVRASKARDGHIETLRGFACLLLVAYHVVGNDMSHGMHIVGMDGWRLFTELFIHVRMPLFSFISGYVFVAIVADRTNLHGAIVKKLRRIGLPFLVLSTLFYLCFGIVNHDFGQPIWHIYVLPYEHFWYLQATLLIMMVLLVMSFLAGTRARAMMTVLFPIACLVFILAPAIDPDVFAVSSALYLLPYFLLGQLLHLWNWKPADRARIRPVMIALGLLIAGLFIVYFAQLIGLNHLDFERQSALGLLFGVSTCLFLFFSRFEFRPLEKIGANSYTIYLFHVFFTALVHRVLQAIDPQVSDVLLFIVAVPAGIFLPMALHHALVRSRWSALLFLGIDRRPKPVELQNERPSPSMITGTMTP